MLKNIMIPKQNGYRTISENIFNCGDTYQTKKFIQLKIYDKQYNYI